MLTANNLPKDDARSPQKDDTIQETPKKIWTITLFANPPLFTVINEKELIPTYNTEKNIHFHFMIKWSDLGVKILWPKNKI